MLQSHTAVIARNEVWSGHVETEPYEVAWASELIVFARALEPATVPEGAHVRVQLSPDGIHWCDEGSVLPLGGDPETPTFARLTHFGGWVRLHGELAEGVVLKVVAYLALKG